MKKIVILATLISVFSSCEKILDKSPSEGGIVEFSQVEQYDALLNSIFITRNRYEWQSAILASDDCYFSPDWQTYNPTLANGQLWEGLNVWNPDVYKSRTGTAVPFTSTYNYMYNFNYIIGTIDDPKISGSPILKKQVKAEAHFWRAMYHFMIAVEFCQHPSVNNGETPGIGYRNTYSTSNTGIEERKTVKYTFDNIVADLEEAERGLVEAGQTDFKITSPWRISTVAVQSLLARVHLYLGNYAKAFENAKKAYAAYSFLYDLNNTTLFTLRDLNPPQTETYNGVTYTVTPKYPAISADNATNDPASNNNYWYKEAFFRFSSQFGVLFKMPPSKELYESYASNDLRKSVYYDNNQNINTLSYLPARLKDQLISKSYIKNSNSISQMGYILGTTVPEMMLIMAECRARGAGDGENPSVILKELRKKRFPAGFVDNIGGTLKDVKEERRRELAMLFRWHDLKRYNALDNDNITVTKLGRRDVFLLSSDIVTYKLAPNSPAYALPIPQAELELLGWPQNTYSGVTFQ